MHTSILGSVPLFAALPQEELTRLATTLRQVSYPADTILFHEGDTGAHFYIVLEGQIAVIKALGTTEERLLGMRRAGEFIGEMSLLSADTPRTASIRASQDTRLVVVTRRDFDDLLHRYPLIAYEMLRVVSDRLRAAGDATIHDLQLKNQQLTQAYIELQQAQAQLIEQETLRRELQQARDIQEQMLPRSLPHIQGIAVGARMLPARMVGGDFYDVFPLGSNQLGLAVGDVCGKGIPAALLMALVSSLLRAEAERSDSPADTLRAVNRQLLSRSFEGMFVTLLYGILDHNTRSFRFARAGHELPIFWDAQGIILPTIRGLGHPLGLLDEPAIDHQTMTLPAGGALLLYSDGVTEATNIHNLEYGTEHIAATIQQSYMLPPQALCEHFIELLDAFQNGATQADDITLLAAQIE